MLNQKRLTGDHNQSNTHAGWSLLPPDLLHLILKRLTLPDYLRFGTVCKSWRSIEIEKAHSPAPDFPWLMLRPVGYNAVFDFFSHFEKRIYRLKLPEAEGARCCGSSEGWLVMIHRTNFNIFLLNPFSRARIQLPNHSRLGGKFNYVKKTMVFLTEPNSDNSNLMIVMIYGELSNLALCRPGDETWNCLEDVFWYYNDIIFYNGKLYAITTSSAIDVFSIDGPCVKWMVRIEPPLTPNYTIHNYLVECGGDLLMVLRHCGEKREWFIDQTVGFEVFKLELDMSSPRVTRIVNLGNQVLFFGIDSSLSLPVHNDNFPGSGLRGNHIYFTGSPYESRDVCALSLVDGSIKPFYSLKFSLIDPPKWVTPKPF